MNHTIEEVCTGEVKTSDKGRILTASALGSCIAISIYDPQKRVGGMAHIMLPGRAPVNNSSNQSRYAENGIEDLIRQITSYGSNISRLHCIIAGGANVLKREDDTVCKMNIDSTLETLKEKGLKIDAYSLGGEMRRRIKFNIEDGIISCKEGDGDEAVLWKKQQVKN